MSALRDEIRAILREEFAALKGEVPCIPTREVVRVANSADLMRFAQDLVARAADPVFAARVARGEMGFELAAQAPAGGPIVSGPAKPPATSSATAVSPIYAAKPKQSLVLPMIRKPSTTR